MKFGSQYLYVIIDKDFIMTFDKWKEKIVKEGIKKRLQKLIESDLKENILKREHIHG